MSLAAIAPPGNPPSIKNLNAATQTKQRLAQTRSVAQEAKENEAKTEKQNKSQPNKKLYNQENSAEQVKSRFKNEETKPNRISVKA